MTPASIKPLYSSEQAPHKIYPSMHGDGNELLWPWSSTMLYCRALEVFPSGHSLIRNTLPPFIHLLMFWVGIHGCCRFCYKWFLRHVQNTKIGLISLTNPQQNLRFYDRKCNYDSIESRPWIPSHIFVDASIHQFQLPLLSSSASSITINKECSLPASLLHPSNSTMELSNSFKSQSIRWRGVNKLSLSASMYACMGPSIHDVSDFFRIFGPPLPPYPHWATDQNCKSTQPLHFH